MADDDALEPLLEIDEIQGNILTGFNKDHQRVLTFVAPDGDGGRAALRRWLAEIAPSITWMREVELERRTRRQLRARSIAMVPIADVWTAVAFSFAGLRKLRDDADRFLDPVFRKGLDGEAADRLGDPQTPDRRGHVSHWVVGGDAARMPDAIVILAADDAARLDASGAAAREHIEEAGGRVLSDDTGHDPSWFSTETERWPRGIEHFGFKDGVGRPGVRGRVSLGEGGPPLAAFLTARTLPEPDDIAEIAYATPGRPLVSPGAFVLGYPRQNATLPGVPLDAAPLGDAPDAQAPAWAANGSFLVFRRLAQDVPLFNRFLAAESARLNAAGGEWADLGPDELGARLVGRWRSGAPIARFPGGDPREEGPSIDADDAFLFAAPLEASDGFPSSPADPSGTRCPFAAHIRKVNPRDANTDQGVPADTLTRRLLRRGIPYGPPLPVGTVKAPDGDGERGLLFLAYAESIARQFEFLCVQWANDVRNPSLHDAGQDMIIGQTRVSTRRRFASLHGEQVDVSTDAVDDPDWVFARGGGYFFAPSRAAVALLAYVAPLAGAQHRTE